MGLFKKIRKAIHKVDPLSKAIDKKIGNVDKKKPSTPSTGTTSSRGSAGGTGPQTQDMGPAKRATVGGGNAMSQARNITAGARSGVGRLQKQRLK